MAIVPFCFGGLRHSLQFPPRTKWYLTHFYNTTNGCKTLRFWKCHDWCHVPDKFQRPTAAIVGRSQENHMTRQVVSHAFVEGLGPNDLAVCSSLTENFPTMARINWIRHAFHAMHRWLHGNLHVMNSFQELHLRDEFKKIVHKVGIFT